MGEPALLQPGLEVPQVAPGLVVLQPRVHQRLVHREPLALLHLQQVSDQVDGFTGYLLPWVWRVHERGVLDLLVDVFVLVEWECS